MRLTFTFVIYLFLSSLAMASQQGQVKQANELFKQQKWDEAIDRYLDALQHDKNTDIIQYDLGAAFYKKGNYDQSIEHLQKAVSSKNKGLSSQTHYNLGNALYRKGQSLENKDIDKAIHSMQESLDSFDKTLQIDEKDKDAQYNKTIVKEAIERLKKKKQQQQDKGKDQQKNKEEQNQQQQSSGEKKRPQGQKQQQDQQQDKQQEAQKKSEKQQQGQEQNEQRQQAKQAQEELKNLEKKQAQDILEDYQREDEPKGLLNFASRNRGEKDVDKDW